MSLPIRAAILPLIHKLKILKAPEDKTAKIKIKTTKILNLLISSIFKYKTIPLKKFILNNLSGSVIRVKKGMKAASDNDSDNALRNIVKKTPPN